MCVYICYLLICKAPLRNILLLLLPAVEGEATHIITLKQINRSYYLPVSAMVQGGDHCPRLSGAAEGQMSGTIAVGVKGYWGRA